MTRLLPKFSALMLLVAMMAATTSVFATPAHQACVTQMHECDDVPTLAECCCPTADGDHQSTPPEQRVEVRASVALATPVVHEATFALPAEPSLYQPTTISPRFSRLDLTTLFATLLI